MTLQLTDIAFTLSGGTTNTNPDASLGGDPSVQHILNNKLFADVTPQQAASGLIDYRCFYVTNESAADTLYSAQLFFQNIVPGAVTVAMGFNFQNERQVVNIANADQITDGSFTLAYIDVSNQYNFTVPYNSNYAQWAANFQAALNAIPNLGDVQVLVSQTTNSVSFEIDFLGSAGNRFHDQIVLISNSLNPAGATGIAIVKTVNGGPINSVADLIDVATTTPNGIVFVPGNASPVLIGDLRPLDTVPVWIKRVVPANTEAIENDGFTFRVIGSSIA
jgi:hypothetical protein